MRILYSTADTSRWIVPHIDVFAFATLEARRLVEVKLWQVVDEREETWKIRM
jgi:hypothetical protein